MLRRLIIAKPVVCRYCLYRHLSCMLFALFHNHRQLLGYHFLSHKSTQFFARYFSAAASDVLPKMRSDEEQTHLFARSTILALSQIEHFYAVQHVWCPSSSIRRLALAYLLESSLLSAHLVSYMYCFRSDPDFGSTLVAPQTFSGLVRKLQSALAMAGCFDEVRRKAVAAIGTTMNVGNP